MAEPPRSESQGLPGSIIVLGALSVLILLLALAVGLIGFGIVDIDGEDTPTPIAVATGEELQFSGFTVRESRQVENRREMDVDVSVTNTGGETLANTTLIVQCLDGGNVSDSQLIPSIAPGETITYSLMLTGTGEPGCTSPVVDFDTP
ncbi:MAG: hypothetical protein KC435_04925 [Thermomicrobiales bacterium]|nr:hypothetical protein [Thermomicrobiales bacterium]